MLKFMHQANRFSDARRALMLPHARNEIPAIIEAITSCRDALTNFDRSELTEDRIQDLLHSLDQLLDVSTLVLKSNEDPYHRKATLLTDDELQELSEVIDEIATWFEVQFAQ